MNRKLVLPFVAMCLSIACAASEVAPRLLGNSHDGWMCFASGKDIWVVRTDGSELQNVTNTESVWETDCKLSWNTRQILYTDLDGNLYLSNRNGTGKNKLLENKGVKYPSWSADNTKIVYVQMNVVNDTPVTSIHVLEIESQTDAMIYELSPAAIIGPVMSPDGTKIAFASGGISILDLESSKVEEILPMFSDEFPSFLSWSKDGKRIAFMTMVGVRSGAETWAEYGNIYVVNVDGSDLTNLTNNEPDPSVTLSTGKNILTFASLPSWTNGDQIVFLSNTDSHDYAQKPYIMHSDGTSIKLLIDQEMQSMDYQPDFRENSTPVPTTIDIPTAESNIEMSATTTALAATLAVEGCRDAIHLPVDVDWRTAKCHTFSSDNGDWWTGSHESEYSTYSKEIKNGEFVWDVNPKRGSVITASLDDIYSDFLVTVTVDVENGNDRTGSGIVFRKNEDDKYIFIIRALPQTYYVGSRLNSEWHAIVNRDYSSAINSQGFNQLAVLGRGTEFTIFINGVKVYQFSDADLVSGQIGLAAEVSDAALHPIYHFDNFLLLVP